MAENNLSNLFNISQAAYILKVHPLTVRRYIREQKLKAIKVGGNVRIKETDLSDFAKDFVPHKQTFKGKIIRQDIKIFNEIDPFFQLQGKGASLNI